MNDARAAQVGWVMEELGCRDEGHGFRHCTTHWTWPRNFVDGDEWECPTVAKIVDTLTARIRRVEAVLAIEWRDEPPSATYPDGRRLYRWPGGVRAELLAALNGEGDG